MSIEYKNIIKRIITEKVKENPENGLLLINAPTGYGKTEQIIQFAAENHMDHKIFIITSQLKVLPEKEQFIKGLAPELREKVQNQILVLNSIRETYDKEFNDDLINQIKKDSIFYKDNSDIIFKLQELFTIKSDVINEIFNKTERIFRERIKVALNDKKIRIEWVKKLYPTIELKDKSIVLMTVKKFFNKIDTIIDGSFYLYQDKIYDESLIIIDEFDNTKKELLDIIISEKDNDFVEVFRLFRKLDSAILDDNLIKGFPIDYYNDETSSGSEYATEYQNALRIEFENINEEIRKLFLNTQLDTLIDKNYYPLKTHFKTEEFNQNKAFLFNDGQKTTVIGSKDNLKYSVEPYQGYNLITMNMSKELNNITISQLYKQAKKGINSFVHLTSLMIVKDYVKAHESLYGKTQRKEVKLQDIYVSIIDKMNLGIENKKYLVNEIRNRIASFRGNKKNSLKYKENDFDKRRKASTFYNRGFSYVTMHDSEDHNIETKFLMCDYNKTPEYYISELCKKYFVIGLSATALYPSILKNYDLDYLKLELGEKYSTLNDEQIKEIGEDYEKINAYIYKDTTVDVKTTEELLGKTISLSKSDSDNYFNHVINKVFVGNNIKGIYDNHLRALSEEYDNKGEYFLDVIASLYLVVKEFSENKELNSFIYFMNINLNNLMATKTLIKGYIKEIDSSINLFILDAKSYKNEYQEFMNNNNKVFIITAYNTVGTGVNLQYKKNNDESKDIEGVFLSKPTNVLPIIKNFESNRTDLAQYIYGLHYLAVEDEISRKELANYVSEAFKTVFSNTKTTQLSHEGKKQFSYAQTLILTQAIGRISRTQNKGKKILICLDKPVEKILSEGIDILESNMITYEMSVVVEKIKKNQRFKNPISDEKKKIYKSSYTWIRSYIPNWKKWNWPDDKIEEWKKIRDFALKYPTIKEIEIEELYKDEFNKQIIDMCYFHEQEIYSYSCKKGFYDYKKNIANGFTKSRYTISGYDAKLNHIVKNIELTSKFEEKYTATFKTGDYIMAPYMYEAIYKGALGEIVGKLILESNNLGLKDIEENDFFEKFDYKYCDDVYFDFKNWSGNFIPSEYAMLKKLDNKIRLIKPTLVFVINTFDVGYDKEHSYKSLEGVKIVTIPRLINENGLIDEKLVSSIITTIVDRRKLDVDK